jgi:hypothetical protein
MSVMGPVSGSMLFACAVLMLTGAYVMAADNSDSATSPSVAPQQAEQSPPPEQCAALPDPQRPENAECVRKRDKEYAERLWLKERSKVDPDLKTIDPPNVDSR